MTNYDKISDGDTTKERLENASRQMEFSEWLKVAATAYNEGILTDCEKVDLFGMPVEAFCVDVDLVEVVGEVDINSRSWGDLHDEVTRVIEESDADPFNKAIGIHTTSMGDGNITLDEGLEGYKETGKIGFTERNGALFFHPHYTSVGKMNYEHPDGLVVMCPAGDVRVSSYMNYEMFQRRIITADQYDNHHTLSYYDYVDCVEDGHYADRVVGPGTLF